MMRLRTFGAAATVFFIGFLAGCAGSAPDSGAGKTPATETGSTGLQAIKPDLRTPEDSLVLDLLIGYRMLLQKTDNADALDSGALRRARNAGTQLEYMLRYGGVVNRGREGRVFTLPDGTRFTLQELVDQMSPSLLRYDSGDAWRPEADRAREIQRHKPDLSALVEDANWVLALSAALESPLPGGVKNQLRHLHESYARGLPHEEIAKQVNDLLPKVTDEHLRREMKKLANRSWDRDKRAGVKPDSLPRAAAGAVGPLLLPVPSAVPESVPAKTDSTPSPPPVATTPLKTDSTTEITLKEAKDRVDSLASHGEYLEALSVLESVEGQPGADWVDERRQTLGNRYCEDRRATAATAFLAAHKTSNDSARIQDLRQSLSALDSCLFQFPNAPIAAKVRRNRAMVEKELDR